MWSILDNVPCALEKNVYSFFGCNVLKFQLHYCSIVSFRFSVALLIFYLIVLWLEKMLDMISIFFNLVWLAMWSVLENVPCTLEKNVYSAAFGRNAL